MQAVIACGIAFATVRMESLEQWSDEIQILKANNVFAFNRQLFLTRRADFGLLEWVGGTLRVGSDAGFGIEKDCVVASGCLAQ